MTARYTLKKLTDVEDSAPKFGYDELQEARLHLGHRPFDRLPVERR